MNVAELIAAQTAGDPDVLVVGAPELRAASRPVTDVRDARVRAAVHRAHQALARFRARHGFGRAIAAPQVGALERFVALHLAHWSEQPLTMFNPEIIETSPDTFTLWDDCLSFPGLLVRVRRHCSVSVRYQDEAGREVVRRTLSRADSELVQHEIDHLDGVLALDRALEGESVVERARFEAHRARFEAEVDGMGASTPRAT